MMDLNVEIIELPPMWVASSLGFGKSPEPLAIEALLSWAEPLGLLEEAYVTYGFNNPDPSPGSPNYGYEIWLPVTGAQEGSGSIEIKHFTGGLYAVARCDSVDRIGDVWKALVRWREGSSHEQGHHQWLEKVLVPLDSPFADYEFDLYLPVSE